MKAPIAVTLSSIVFSVVLVGGFRQTVQSVAAMEAHSGQASTAPPAITPVSTRLLAASDFSRIVPRLDRSRIPNVIGQIKPNAQQSFSIKGQGFPQFSIVPVRYESTSADNQEPSFRCGVYVVLAAGDSTFVRTLGYDNREAEICGGLLGVGFLPEPSLPPRIILLYQGGSFNSPGRDPVILAWDRKAKRYGSDDDVVRRLGNATTILAIKEKLKVLER